MGTVQKLWTVSPLGVKRKFTHTYTNQMATAFISELHWWRESGDYKPASLFSPILL